MLLCGNVAQCHLECCSFVDQAEDEELVKPHCHSTSQATGHRVQGTTVYSSGASGHPMPVWGNFVDMLAGCT